MPARNVKPARTTSGGEESFSSLRRLGGGPGEATPSPVEEGSLLPDDCFQGPACWSVLLLRCNLLHRPTSSRNLLRRPPSRRPAKAPVLRKDPACWVRPPREPAAGRGGGCGLQPATDGKPGKGEFQRCPGLARDAAFGREALRGAQGKGRKRAVFRSFLSFSALLTDSGGPSLHF